MSSHPSFIAEASSNRGRDLARTLEFIDEAAIKFHLNGKGAEYAAGHCWLPDEIAPVIARIREAALADGNGFKEPQASELADRESRADPSDGMRPLKHVRVAWKPAA